MPEKQTRKRREPNLRLHVATPQELELREQLKAAQVEVEKASEWRMDIRKQVEQADSVAKHWKGEADTLRAENNELRRQLFDALLDSERMRGYLDGTVDAEPTPMVPAQRERRLDRYTGTPGRVSMLYEEPGGYRGGQRQKRWFER
jgi:hypothetical protein